MTPSLPISIRVSPEVLDRITAIASETGKTRSAVANELLEKALGMNPNDPGETESQKLWAAMEQLQARIECIEKGTPLVHPGDTSQGIQPVHTENTEPGTPLVHSQDTAPPEQPLERKEPALDTITPAPGETAVKSDSDGDELTMDDAINVARANGWKTKAKKLDVALSQAYRPKFGDDDNELEFYGLRIVRELSPGGLRSKYRIFKIEENPGG